MTTDLDSVFTAKVQKKIMNQMRYWNSLKKKPRPHKPKNYHHGHWCLQCCVRLGYSMPNPIMFQTKWGMIGRFYDQSKFRYRTMFRAAKRYNLSIYRGDQ